MRFRSSHLIIVAAIALLLLGAAAVFYFSQQEQGREQRAKAAERLRPVPDGRERCMQKCAALQKGYIYRAQQRVEGPEGSQVKPELCRCV